MYTPIGFDVPAIILNLNIFFSISFRKFLKARGWNERAQRELSNKPIKNDFKIKVTLKI